MPWGPPREAPPAERGLRIPGAGDCRVAARRGRGQVWGGGGISPLPVVGAEASESVPAKAGGG